MITANDFVPRLRTKMKPTSRTPKRAPREVRLPDDHIKGPRSETGNLKPN